MRYYGLVVVLCFCLSLTVQTKRVYPQKHNVSPPRVVDEELVGVFYKVIGNANFDAELVRFSTTSGSVEVVGNVANVYASYNTPGALGVSSGTFYWPYPHNTGGTAFYVASLSNGFKDVFYYDSATVNLHFNSQQKLLYVITTDESKNYNFSSIDVEQKQVNQLFSLKDFPTNVQSIGSTLDEQTGSYFVVNGTILATIDIAQKTISFTPLTGDCIGTISIFFDSHFELLFGLQITNQTVSVVKMKPNGDCALVQSLVTLRPYAVIYDAAYNQQTSNIAFVYPTDSEENGSLIVFNLQSETITHQFPVASPSYYTGLSYHNLS